MLKPIKQFYVCTHTPAYSDFEEAVQIAKDEDCVVDVWWLPSTWAGWYHEYVFEHSDPGAIMEKLPRSYGV